MSRALCVALALPAAALWAASCGSSDADAPKSGLDGGAGEAALIDSAPWLGPDGCARKSCDELKAECGQVIDECAGLVDCGGCPSGEFCGGAGVNRCGTTPCVPKTCADFGDTCGLFSDGCGPFITCSACQFPESCGGGGVQGQCGCTKQTCASLGVQCGVADDGCGGNVDCGPCTGPAVCGNGSCETGENGTSCGQDCCDAFTACSQAKQNLGVLFCRSINSGPYQWYTEAQGITYCDETNEICKTTFACGGSNGVCAGIPGKYIAGPCPVCGDGVCAWPEDGTSCGQDCCDAGTLCDVTKQNQGVLFCRQFNGGPYGWYTEQQGISYCDEASEMCSAKFACGGQTGVCNSIPGGWVFGNGSC